MGVIGVVGIIILKIASDEAKSGRFSARLGADNDAARAKREGDDEDKIPRYATAGISFAPQKTVARGDSIPRKRPTYAPTSIRTNARVIPVNTLKRPERDPASSTAEKARAQRKTRPEAEV